MGVKHTLAKSSALPMRPGGTRAPTFRISCWNAESSWAVLSFLSSEAPVVISEGYQPYTRLLDICSFLPKMYVKVWEGGFKDGAG